MAVMQRVRYHQTVRGIALVEGRKNSRLAGNTSRLLNSVNNDDLVLPEAVSSELSSKPHSNRRLVARTAERFPPLRQWNP